MDWLTLPCVCHGQTRTGTGLAKLIHITKHITETHQPVSSVHTLQARSVIVYTS